MHIFNEIRSSVSKDKGVMLLPYYLQLNPISTYTYIYTHYEKSVVFLFVCFFSSKLNAILHTLDRYRLDVAS